MPSIQATLRAVQLSMKRILLCTLAHSAHSQAPPEIQGFWQKLIDDGFKDVEYIDPKIEVLDDSSALLTSGWKMNNAGGVIHRELWVIQADGSAKLREDDFEAKA